MSSVLFEYGWAPTLFHRMHPFTKLFLIFFLGSLVTLWWDYRFAVPLFIIIYSLTRIARVPKSWYNIIWAGLAVGLFNPLSNINLLYGYVTPFKVYTPEFTDIVLIRLTEPATPILGETYITVGSLLWKGMVLIHMCSTIMVIMTFLYSTSVMDFCDALAHYGVPNVVMFVLIVMTRFTAVFQRRFLTIMNAQKLRGWELSKNPVRFVREAKPLLYPLTYITITMIDEVTVATRIRAFRVRKVSPMRFIIWPMGERALLVVLTTILAFAIWAQFWSGYNIGMF